MRLSLVFSILLTVAAGLSIVRRAENIGLTYETQMDIGFDKACLDEGAISKFLIDFQSEDSAKVERQRALMIEKSRQSETCKKQIVMVLMNAMDKPTLDFDRDKRSYYLWLHGADLLGDLRAAEALELLISRLNVTSRFFSTSMNHQPALRGVIKMGAIALPRLEDLLRQSPDLKMRHSAVYCIATIGGPAAEQSLRSALVSESDECIKHFIRASLESFDEEGVIKNRMEWFARSLCKD